MRKLVWFKLFFAFVTLPVWARCGFQTNTLTVTSSATVNGDLVVKSLPAGRIPYLATGNVFTSTADLRWETFFQPMLYAHGMSLGYSGYADQPGVKWWGTYSTPAAYLDDVCADADAAFCPRIIYDSGDITLKTAFGTDNSIRMEFAGDFGFFPDQADRLKFLFGPSLTQFAQIYATPSNTGAGTEGGKVVTEVISASTTTAAFIVDGNTRITTSSFPIVAPYFTPSTASAYTNGQLLFGVTATGGLNVSSMSGTTNQVTVTASSFNVTLSLPQSINTGATTQFSQMGLGTPGGTSQRLKIVAGTTTQCPITLSVGTLKTSGQAAGDIENNVDDLYYTIQTGTARKNVVLADSALTTGGHLAYTTTNGRLIDNSFLTYVGNRVALSAGSAGGAISISAGGRPNPVTAGDIWVDTTTARLRAGLQSSTQTFAMIGSSETWTSTQTWKNDIDIIGTGKLTTNGAQIGLNISTYSASGTYDFTTTTNTLAIGTSSSTITLVSSGTYRIDSMANMRYNGATFAANQFVTLHLYRQNNTPGVVSNSQTQQETQISVGALTNQFGQYNLNPIFYTTTNTNDIISLQGSITAAPGAGSFQATEASVVAQRLY